MVRNNKRKASEESETCRNVTFEGRLEFREKDKRIYYNERERSDG